MRPCSALAGKRRTAGGGGVLLTSTPFSFIYVTMFLLALFLVFFLFKGVLYGEKKENNPSKGAFLKGLSSFNFPATMASAKTSSIIPVINFL